MKWNWANAIQLHRANRIGCDSTQNDAHAILPHVSNDTHATYALAYVEFICVCTGQLDNGMDATDMRDMSVCHRRPYRHQFATFHFNLPIQIDFPANQLSFGKYYCNRWFTSDENDWFVAHRLIVDGEENIPYSTWSIWVCTALKRVWFGINFAAAQRTDGSSALRIVWTEMRSTARMSINIWYFENDASCTST